LPIATHLLRAKFCGSGGGCAALASNQGHDSHPASAGANDDGAAAAAGAAGAAAEALVAASRAKLLPDAPPRPCPSM
jgi:hypothetical protein